MMLPEMRGKERHERDAQQQDGKRSQHAQRWQRGVGGSVGEEEHAEESDGRREWGI